MKKLNNEEVISVKNSFSATTGMCPTNCSACHSSGCACTKCYDSVTDVTEEVKKTYSPNK